MNAKTTLTKLAYGIALGTTISLPASALSIAQTPLFVSASVDPNLMLLVDTSGSMDNAVWADGYDNTVTYPDWSYSWDPTDGNVGFSSIKQGSCSSGWKQGTNGATNKCLKLPDPAGGGNTRYDGNYLDYLFQTYANGTDLTTGTIPNETRMQVARAAATNLVTTTTGVRFGVAEFYGPSSQNYGYGATIDADCGSSTSTITSKISTYTANTNTPLAEALYEITRYFRGMSSYYHTGTTYTSPIQYRCQHNFAVVITDGYPTRDTQIPTDDPADVADTSHALPNWDGLAPATSRPLPGVVPQYSDGFQPAGTEAEEGYSLYLDDIAKFGYDIDFKTSGTDIDGGSYQDPKFLLQHMETYTIGFAQNNQMLQDAAEYGHGLYFTANNSAQLNAALQKAVADAQYKGQAAAAAVATNSTRLDSGTKIYQARFDSSNWTGDLLAYSINPSTGVINATADWSAKDKLPPSSNATVTSTSRKIVTFDRTYSTTGKGINFQWPSNYTALSSGTDFNSSMVQSLLTSGPYAWNTTNTTQQAANQTYGSELVAWLRGSTSTSGTYNGGFRNRSTVLGDIVGSNPTFETTQDFGYKVLPSTEGSSYVTFRQSLSYLNRTPTVFVGANDGMLHALNGNTGSELFAYVPSTTFPSLSALSASNYTHKYYVNGSPRIGDAYLYGSWKTILVGASGAGGKGIFALDVTYPSSFDASKVMWELTDSDDADMGYVLGQPTIIRMNDGNWYAVTGNGYGSTNNHAVLFLVNLATRAVTKIDTGVGSSTSQNGLSSPVPVDINGDRITDVIYAGDLRGNLWKFDVSGNTPASWKSAFSHTGGAGTVNDPLFTATDGSGNVQPITVRPAVSTHPNGGYLIFFGTGKFFETGDNVVPASPAINTFYGIRDTGVTVTGRTSLQQQTIDVQLQNQVIGTQTYDIRVVSNNTVDYSSKSGWYLDLVKPVTGSSPPTWVAQGERVIVDPLVTQGRIIFSTLIPNADRCGYGGEGWLMEIDAVNGSRFAYSVFDLNGDGKIDASDFVSVNGNQLPVSGIRFGEIISAPTIVQAGEIEHKYISGSSGTIAHVVEKGAGNRGRQSWRQLR